MATFAGMLQKIFHPQAIKTLLEIPGRWEALKADFTESPPGALWSHSVDGGFADCLLGSNFESLFHMNMVISRPKFTWQGHQLEVKKGRDLRRIVVNLQASDAAIQKIYSAVVDGITLSRQKWKTCKHCSSSQPRAYMHEPGVCMGCAPSALGVVY